ncbi:MAG: hypothetical protein ACYC63_08740 [Armatimonadota bacterium]
MKTAAAAVLVIALMTLSHHAQAAGEKVLDYTGWQILVTGIEITNSTFHSSLGYTVDDKCTVIKRGNSRYIIKKNDWGEGLERFSMDLVSASTTITVSGQGKANFHSATPPVTKNWSYRMGPSDYPRDMESFRPGNGGKPQSSPDEPMFMPRRISVSSNVPESQWGVTPEENSSLAQAKNVTIAAWEAAGGGTPSALEFVFPHRLDAKHLTASGHRSFTYEPAGGIAEIKVSSQIEVTYNVRVIPAQGNPKPPKVELTEIDRNWWPENENSLTATIMVHGEEPAEAFRLTLYDVSKEPGVCCNSADDGTDPDLRFSADGGWAIEKQGDQSVATLGEKGTEASLEIECRDWGAWGKLKGEAKIDGKWEPAKVAGGLSFVRIPFDDDDDHIADSWQALYGVGDKTAKDDTDKRPTDQANSGDGLSIYECYRGFEVLTEADKEHVYIDPRQKVLFFLDDSGYFSGGIWEHATGMKAYALNGDMCKQGGKPEAARKVNFRSSYAKNGDKYCIPITTVKGPYTDSDGDMLMGLAVGPGGGCPKCPREVEALYLYPGNALVWINTFATRLGIAAAQPNSPEAREFDELGLPRGMWKRASDKLSEGYRQQLADMVTRQTAIHEMGHCCGLMGHYDKNDPGQREMPVGNKNCPMRYSDHVDDLRFFVLQVLMKPDAPLPMTIDQFCRDADFNCWGHLNVKDN